MKLRSLKKTAAGGKLIAVDAARVRRRRAQSSVWMHPVNVALGRVIREWRVRRGLAASEVAEWALVSRGTLADVEAAQSWFSVNVLMRV